MATELQKHLRGNNADVLTDLVAGEIAIAEDTNTVIAMFDDGATTVELVSLERLDDTGVGASGAALVGVDQTSLTQISGADVQAVIEDIDTTLASLTGSISGFTQGSILFADPTGDPTEDNANLFWDDTANQMKVAKLGVGGTLTDGVLHVLNGSAGAVDAHVNANTAVFETNSADGISILGPDASNQNIYFGSTSSNLGAKLQWNYDGDSFVVGTTKAGASTILRSGDNVTALTLDGNQDATFAGNVDISAGVLTMSTGTIGYNSTGGIQFDSSNNLAIKQSIVKDADNSLLQIFGGTGAGDSRIRMWGSAHATKPNEIDISQNTQIKIQISSNGEMIHWLVANQNEAFRVTDTTGVDYINVDSTTGSEKIDFGEASTTDPDYNFLGLGTVKLTVLTNAQRPAAGTAGRVFFNSDDGNLNIDTGANWILPDGTVT